MKRLTLILFLITLCANGCTMMEHLAPHQLWKLNRQPAQSRDDALFSIPAQPIPKANASHTVVNPF